LLLLLLKVMFVVADMTWDLKKSVTNGPCAPWRYKNPHFSFFSFLLRHIFLCFYYVWIII
jgi:hypothetical protein